MVKETLQRIHKALAHNPDLSPFGPIPYGEEGDIGGGGAVAEGTKKKMKGKLKSRLMKNQLKLNQNLKRKEGVILS